MNNLSKLRKKHNITQEELASRLNITKQSVCFWENHKITPKTALICAEVLGENVFEVLGDDVFVLKPKTQEEKDKVIEILKEM